VGASPGCFAAAANDLNRKRNAADKAPEHTMEHGHAGGNLPAEA